PLQFQVRRTRDAVDKSGTDSRLWSDIYVFAAQGEKDPESWNILDMNQWRFYCLKRRQVDALPQSFPEHRLEQYCPPLKAAEVPKRTMKLIDEVRSTLAGAI